MNPEVRTQEAAIGSERLLHHIEIRAPERRPERWMLFLHGIFGSGRNWLAVARRLVSARPEWGALLVDLRGHGESTGFAGPHTIVAAVTDMERLIAEVGVDAAAVLGHSFGGKVVLEYTRRHTAAVDQVWIVDSSPASSAPRGGAWRMLGLVQRMPGPFDTREEVVSALRSEGMPSPAAQWMSTNLERADGGFRWRFDVDAVGALLRDYFRIDGWGIIEAPPPPMEIHVVKAEGSDLLTEEACTRIEAAGRATGRVWLHRLAGGHWLNADNADGMAELLTETLP